MTQALNFDRAVSVFFTEPEIFSFAGVRSGLFLT
jgi:hypothetical protein